MQFIFNGQTITDDSLKREKWLGYLYNTREHHVNPERTDKMEELSKGNKVLLYVEKTLKVLEVYKKTLSERDYRLVETALKWCEVSKCGMPEDREKWESMGLSLEIHNEASAEIYRLYAEAGIADKVEEEKVEEKAATDKALTDKAATDKTADKLSIDEKIVYSLIFTHGLIGQYIRGENNFSVHKPLKDLVNYGMIDAEELSRVLYAINHCVIAGVSESLWESVKDRVKELIKVICTGDVEAEKIGTAKRLGLLFPAFNNDRELSGEERELFETVFSKCDLWYSEAALESFSEKEIVTIFTMLAERINEEENIRHISFYPFAANILYDYEGHKKVNIYKKRICELCLRELAEKEDDAHSAEHVSVKISRKEDTLYFDMQFTPVCNALVNFCVEAERSGIMTYEKSIQTIFDLFGFRRDIFDRLNNEEKYLQTMNDAKNSTKCSILDYVKGGSVVDVGSGGGVLLDMLEQKFGEQKIRIIGTDISTNVIEALEKKIEKEGHKYSVRRHNFVEEPMDTEVDSILFSSILHEVYSYTELDGKKFNINSVALALKNACDSLSFGGRLIIRDGVLSDSEEIVSVKFLKSEGISFCRNYIKDFKGLTKLRSVENPEKWDDTKVHFADNVLTGDVNFVREALYTYTWGSESYAHEVQEQFGYYTLKDYCKELEKLGMRIVTASAFTEAGYPEHLNPDVELQGQLTWEKMPSTCIIVAEK